MTINWRTTRHSMWGSIEDDGRSPRTIATGNCHDILRQKEADHNRPNYDLKVDWHMANLWKNGNNYDRSMMMNGLEWISGWWLSICRIERRNRWQPRSSRQSGLIWPRLGGGSRQWKWGRCWGGERADHTSSKRDKCRPRQIGTSFIRSMNVLVSLCSRTTTCRLTLCRSVTTIITMMMRRRSRTSQAWTRNGTAINANAIEVNIQSEILHETI